MALNKRNEGVKVNSNINVTPMVDVMLVLLIIFMVITPMLQHGVSVDMAKVNNPESMPDADKEDALLVSVMRDGTVYFGTDTLPADQLTGKVKDRLASRMDKRVFVKAGARARRGSGPTGIADRTAQDDGGSSPGECDRAHWRTIAF